MASSGFIKARGRATNIEKGKKKEPEEWDEREGTNTRTGDQKPEDRENGKAKKTEGRTRGENTEKIQRGERTRKKPVEREGDEEENTENRK